jgi:hypothetical protein
MTREEIFDKAILGLMAQGKLGRRGKFWNSYTDGCAIGQLMAEEQRIKYDEARCAFVENIVRDFPNDKLALELAPETEFCAELQFAHDVADDLCDFIKQAKQLATKYNLTFPGELK